MSDDPKVRIFSISGRTAPVKTLLENRLFCEG